MSGINTLICYNRTLNESLGLPRLCGTLCGCGKTGGEANRPCSRWAEDHGEVFRADVGRVVVTAAIARVVARYLFTYLPRPCSCDGGDS